MVDRKCVGAPKECNDDVRNQEWLAASGFVSVSVVLSEVGQYWTEMAFSLTFSMR